MESCTEETTEKAVRAATRMYLADRPRVALDYLAEAFDVDPNCYEALVMAGDLYDLRGQELGLGDEQGSLTSLGYYGRAIAARPDHAEAFAGKAIALLHLEEYIAAIQTADQGLRVFDQRPTTDEPPNVWVNIGESLYRAKALALLDDGNEEAGRQALGEGLSRFPDSEYLTQIVEYFLPDLGPA